MNIFSFYNIHDHQVELIDSIDVKSHSYKDITNTTGSRVKSNEWKTIMYLNEPKTYYVKCTMCDTIHQVYLPKSHVYTHKQE